MSSAEDPTSGVRRRLLAGLAEVNLLRLLPAVARDLRAIRGYVATVAGEVTGMNASVGRIEPEVSELGRRMLGLELRTAAIEESIGRLHGHMEQLDATLHPLRRRRRAEVSESSAEPRGGRADVAAPPD